jgi:integrase
MFVMISRCSKLLSILLHDGKPRNAKRNISLTTRVRGMLEDRRAGSKSEWVFARPEEMPMLVNSLDHIHAKIREALKLNPEFVIHSLRHTMLTRLGESGADAFTIMKIAGHSSVSISQRHVHPTPEATEKAMERLDSMNQKALSGMQDPSKRQLPATVSATSPE